jgi:hypothetical protein
VRRRCRPAAAYHATHTVRRKAAAAAVYLYRQLKHPIERRPWPGEKLHLFRRESPQENFAFTDGAPKTTVSGGYVMTGGYGDHYGNGVDILSLDQRKYIL